MFLLVSACVSGTVVFVSGYSAQAQQAIVDVTFAPDDLGSAWVLTGPPDRDLAALLPAGSDRLTEAPVAGRTAEARWNAPRFGPAINATLAWRADSCVHLVLVAGRCPSAPGDVAVSATDAAAYRVRVGDQVTRQLVIGDPVRLVVSGVYRVRDRADPYWFQNPPVGRTRYDPVADKAYGDPLLAVRDQFQGDGFFETLELRLDRTALRTADLSRLGRDTAGLADAAVHAGGRLTTKVPANLQRVGSERARVVTGLALSLTQLAALVLVVLVLLSSVALSSSRAELGLRRLRGERTGTLLRLVLGPWSAAVTVGWLLGWVPGLALLAAAASRLPGDRGLPMTAALLVAPLVTLAVLIVVLVPGARSMLAQPVIALLQAAPSAAREVRARQQLVDLAVVVLAGCGLLVAFQAGTSSVLGLLVPSLLAIGIGVLLFRVIVAVAARRRRQLAVRGVSAGLLTAILMVRLRGLRILVVATCLAAAFAVFAVQLQAIGAGVRRHVAQVRTGAAAVLEVDATPAAVLSALDRLDPRHGTPAAALAAVVVTRRTDPTALRALFTEPLGFAHVAYGASQAAADEAWAAVAAPRVDPVSVTGDAVVVETGPHPDLGRTAGDSPVVTGTQAELRMDYLTSDGRLRSQRLGQLRLAAGGDQRFRQRVACSGGCRLIRITLAPNGPMAGSVPLTTVAISRSGVEQAVDLGAADSWPTVPPADPDDSLQLRRRGGSLSLEARSGGGQVAVQQAWVPTVLPMMLARDVQLGALPTVAAPDESLLPIRAVARAADAVPRELSGVAVADLASVLRAGAGSVAPGNRVQVWVGPAAVGHLGEVQRGLAASGIRVVSTATLAEALFAQHNTASALTGEIAPGLAVLAGVFAALSVALTVAGHRAVLGRDLAALALAGVRGARLRRAVVLTYLAPGVLAVVLGSAAGTAGSALVVGSLPLLPDVTPAIHNDLGLHVGAVAGCVGAALVVLVAVVTVSVHALSRGSTIDQLQGPR